MEWCPAREGHFWSLIWALFSRIEGFYQLIFDFFFISVAIKHRFHAALPRKTHSPPVCGSRRNSELLKLGIYGTNMVRVMLAATAPWPRHNHPLAITNSQADRFTSLSRFSAIRPVWCGFFWFRPACLAWRLRRGRRAAVGRG